MMGPPLVIVTESGTEYRFNKHATSLGGFSLYTQAGTFGDEVR